MPRFLGAWPKHVKWAILTCPGWYCSSEAQYAASSVWSPLGSGFWAGQLGQVQSNLVMGRLFMLPCDQESGSCLGGQGDLNGGEGFCIVTALFGQTSRAGCRLGLGHPPGIHPENVPWVFETELVTCGHHLPGQASSALEHLAGSVSSDSS